MQVGPTILNPRRSVHWRYGLLWGSSIPDSMSWPDLEATGQLFPRPASRVHRPLKLDLDVTDYWKLSLATLIEKLSLEVPQKWSGDVCITFQNTSSLSWTRWHESAIQGHDFYANISHKTNQNKYKYIYGTLLCKIIYEIAIHISDFHK